jgi:uncharacterized protein (DUF433 family)
MASVLEKIPLPKDVHGVFRVGGTRVTLDMVVHAFDRGATAEKIVQDFPSLELSDVYQVIGYYLKHTGEFADCLRQRDRDEAALLANHLGEWQPQGLRDRLQARGRRAFSEVLVPDSVASAIDEVLLLDDCSREMNAPKSRTGRQASCICHFDNPAPS